MGKWDKILKKYEEHCARISKATAVDIHETTAQKRERINKLERDYVTWFEFYFPHYAKGKCGWFHLKMAKLIINNPVILLLLPWFRGAAKSVHICVGIPMFLCLAKGELKYMVLVGENADKAKELLADIQAEFQFNEKISNDYGKHFKHGNWADGDFMTKDGYRFKSIGLGQSPRGIRKGENRPDYIVFDDLDTKKRCNNDRLIREAVDWLMEDLKGCFDAANKYRRFVGANNIIHKNSIMSNLVKLFTEKTKERKTKGKKPIHHIIKVNILDKKGQPEWKEYHTLQMCQDIISEASYRSSQREYFNNPIQDGTVFKGEDIQHKKMLPLKQYDALVLYGDLSYKDQGDYKALKLWGKIGRELHHIHCFCRQASKREAAIWLYNLYESKNLDKPLIRYLIEGLFAMDEFVNEFNKVGEERGYYIPVVADKKTKANKFDRIEAIAGYWERRDVFYNIDEKDHQDQITSIDQTLAFEKGSNAPDDGPDADHGAISWLESILRVEKFDTRIGKRKVRREF